MEMNDQDHAGNMPSSARYSSRTRWAYNPPNTAAESRGFADAFAPDPGGDPEREAGGDLVTEHRGALALWAVRREILLRARAGEPRGCGGGPGAVLLAPPGARPHRGSPSVAGGRRRGGARAPGTRRGGSR